LIYHQFLSSNVKVAIHYYGRLAAKQGWRFDSTYDHKDENGEPIPFVFVLGSGKVSPDISIQTGCHI
jgi:FKBP-type peptidyl-prolyl cis-trans isomerase